MVEIYIDYITKKIVGYNKIVLEESNIFRDSDSIIIEDDNIINEINNYIFSDNGYELYYINGEVVKREKQKNIENQELKDVEQEINLLSEKVENEQKIFMDSIINGLSIEEATKIAKDNRSNLEKLKIEQEKLISQEKDIYKAKLNEIFEQEESKINYKYFLSMVTIVRDENDYLPEWIRYHIEEMNFDHFYIYDNETSVPVKEYLENINFKYLDRITIIPWKTTTASQQDSHNDFLIKYGNETKWFIGMDPDEYIFIKDSSKSLISFLNENSKYATIKCLWRHFNANGHETKTDEPDMVRFTQDTDWEDWKHGGKKFAQSNRIKFFQSYVPWAKLNAPELDYDSGMDRNFIQLNHYYTRSYEEWVQKIKRGSSNPNFRRKYSDFFELNPDMKHLDIGEDYEQGYGSAENNHSDTQENGEI